MIGRLPIRIRVAAAFAVAMAAVLAGSGWYLYSRVADHLELQLNRELELRAQDLAVVARSGGELEGTRSNRFVEPGESYAEVLDGRGRVLDSTRPLGSTSVLRPDELSRALRRPTFAERARLPGLDESSKLLAAPIARPGRRVVLVVGATRQNRAETLSSYRDELLIAGPVALLVATLAGYGLAGLSLRQVESMRRRAAAVSPERAGERLPIPPTGDEVERLATTLNDMLDRLEGGLERERQFVADAGHELRTPLALLRTELELAVRHARSAEELRSALGRASGEVDRLTQLAEDLLLIARVDRGALPLRHETLDAREVVESVLRRFELRAAHEGRTITSAVEPGTRVFADRLRLEQALSNLVDNALRHGDGVVTIASRRRDSGVELHVRDEGRGFDPATLEHGFERFARSGSGETGSGLGLSIVRAIARAHGGEAGARNGRGGGDVWMTFPPPRDA